MSVVVYGNRAFGRVHAHGGEYAETQFIHLNFVPLIPVGSFWITNQPGGGAHFGFPIKLHGWSVVATYLRVWGPALAAFAFMVPSLAMTALSIALAALSAWSWTLRSRHGVRAHQRSDFDRVALGSRCDPAWMAKDMREHLARKLGGELAARHDARPPDDVARFGARDLDEAVLAYGLLRLNAVDHAEAGAAADRLLTAAFDELPSDGGPYREGVAGTAAGIGAAIAATAQRHAAAVEGRLRATGPRWIHNRYLQLLGLVLLTGVAAVTIQGHTSRGTLDDRALSSTQSPREKWSAVRCDRMQDDGWEVLKGDTVEQRITFCWLGAHLLPVVSDADDPVDSRTIEGQVRDLPIGGSSVASSSAAPWIAELHRDPALDAASYNYYLRRVGAFDRRQGLLAMGVTSLGSVIGWALWLRGFRRRRRAA
jgi:hypothetical protein